MALLSADNRLRRKVLAEEGTVLLAQAGFVDKVIRFTELPPSLAPFMTKTFKEDGSVGPNIYPVFLNLDRGPSQEAWKEALRDSQTRGRRDKPIPLPLEVSADPKEGWSVDDEDVPVVEYEKGVEVVSNSLKCLYEGCGMEFRTDNGLRIHKARKKHD